jgi:hypothetical protein
MVVLAVLAALAVYATSRISHRSLGALRARKAVA